MSCYIVSIIMIANMDRASQALAQNLPPDVPRTCAVLSERGDVPLTTLYCHAHGRPSVREKTLKKVLFTILMCNRGQLIRIKYIPSLAFSLARQRSTMMDKPLGKSEARAFDKRYLQVKARRVRLIDWKRHEKKYIH